MKQKSARKVIPALLALLLLLTSCGASSGAGSAASDSASTSQEIAENGSGIYQDATESMDTTSETEEESEMPDGYDQSEVKLIYTAYLELEVLDFDAALADLNRRVETAGGYCESSDLYNYGSIRSADYVIRVPSDQYRSFVDACSQWENCYLLSKSEDVQNVGEEYFDAETRLATLRTKLERLQELLAQATEMEDVIVIESAISETEYQIEQYTSTLNRYDSLIDYATVHITMAEVSDLTEEEGVGLLTRLGQNLRWGAEDFGEGLENCILWVAYHLFDLMLFALVVAVILFLVYRIKRRGKAKTLSGNIKQKPDDSKPEQSDAN